MSLYYVMLNSRTTCNTPQFEARHQETARDGSWLQDAGGGEIIFASGEED